MINETQPPSTTINPLKFEIIEKLNRLLAKQKYLKSEYVRTQENVKNEKRKSIDHKNLEEGMMKYKDLNKESNTDSVDNTAVEKPFFGNFDIVESDSQIEVNRNRRRKNRQRKSEFLSDDGIETLPDQSQSETITRHSVHKHKQNLHNFQFPPSAYNSRLHGEKPANDIRLEIPISLDATISLPKNKQSLEELLDFVMKHDATLLEEYLKERSHYGGVVSKAPPSETYHLPEDHQAPQTAYQAPPPSAEHTTVPDLSHRGFGALVRKPAEDYGVPTTKVCNYFLWNFFVSFLDELMVFIFS